MDVFKIVFPESSDVHTYETGHNLVGFLEAHFGGVEAAFARGVKVLHEDFAVLEAKFSAGSVQPASLEPVVEKPVPEVIAPEPATESVVEDAGQV